MTIETTRVRYPGPLLRPMPEFAIDCPPGFAPIEAPDCVAAFIQSPEADLFSATVVIGTARTSAAVSLAEAASDVLEDASSRLPGYAFGGERTLTVDGLPALLRSQAFDEPRIERRFSQLLVMVMLPITGTGATRDLVHITGTFLQEDLPTYEATFVAAVQSLEFFPADET